MTDKRTERSGPVRLEDLIDLESRLHLDAALDRETLRRRDHAIAREIASKGGDRRALLLAWLDRVRDPTRPLPGAFATRAVRTVRAVLAILGLAAGYGAAAGLLRYDGSRPVNVVHFLGALVFLQIGLVLAWCLAALPRSALARLPGAASVQELLRTLSPGRLAPLIARALPDDYRSSLSTALVRFGSLGRLYEAIRLWLLIGLSQTFAVMFNLGALAGCMSLIVFSDLAFGWSTTLRIDSSRFHEIVRALAAPWSWALPEAVPSLTLVESTRYFRLDSSFALEPIVPGAPGAWWPFLVASLVFYGLLPRVTLRFVSAWRLRSALGRVRFDHAGYERLIERLREPLRDSGAPSLGEARAAEGSTARSGSVIDLAPAPVAVVDWGGVGLSPAEAGRSLARRFGREALSVREAGGLDILSDDRVLAELSPGADHTGSVVILVKSWEAPVRDLRRFLGKLRERVGPGRSVVVALVEKGEDGRPTTPDAEDLRQWRRKLDGLGDPWLRVEALVEPGSETEPGPEPAPAPGAGGAG